MNEEEKQLEGGIGPDHVKVRNIHNNYLQDREEQKRETFTGMGKQFLIHDSCATESMGPIYDRSKEHLGAGDITVIAVRKFLLQSVRALDMGKEPPHIIRTTGTKRSSPRCLHRGEHRCNLGSEDVHSEA